MDVVIRSTQTYEEHTEEIVETYENAVVEVDKDIVKINFEDGNILASEVQGFASYEKGGNLISIKINEKKLLKYETAYGKMEMETVGIRVSISYNPLKIVMEYQIGLNKTTCYKNLVEITEV